MNLGSGSPSSTNARVHKLVDVLIEIVGLAEFVPFVCHIEELSCDMFVLTLAWVACLHVQSVSARHLFAQDPEVVYHSGGNLPE